MFPQPTSTSSGSLNPFLANDRSDEINHPRRLEKAVNPSKATQTSFTTSHPDLSPLGYSLQEGHFESALILLQNGGQLGETAEPGALLKNIYTHLNTKLASQLFSYDQAKNLLQGLQAHNNFLSLRRDLLTNQLREAINETNTESAKLYLEFMDELAFNTCHSPFQPTLVHKALQQGLPDIARSCLEQGADINQTTSRHENLILLCVRLNQPELLPYLISRNLDINATDFHDESALHQAIRRHNIPMVTTLLEHQIQVNIATSEGDTPLHLAIEQDDEQALELLLQHNADPGFPNADNLLPIQLAVEKNKPALVKILLDHHAPTNITDEAGRNLVQFARAANATEVLPLLIQRGALRMVRNDAENAHDSVVNEGFARIFHDLVKAVPPERRLSFESVERVLRQHLTQTLQFSALRTLETIKNEGLIALSHLDHATEQDILALVWSLIEQPLIEQPHTEEPSTGSEHPLDMGSIHKSILKQSLVNRLQDAWNLQTQATVCPSGRANRMLDVFTGLYPGGLVMSKDILQREMLDKASLLRDRFAPEETNSSSESNKIDNSSSLQAYIRENLAHEYVESGIISQSLFDRMLNEWIQFIE